MESLVWGWKLALTLGFLAQAVEVDSESFSRASLREKVSPSVDDCFLKLKLAFHPHPHDLDRPVFWGQHSLPLQVSLRPNLLFRQDILPRPLRFFQALVMSLVLHFLSLFPVPSRLVLLTFAYSAFRIPTVGELGVDVQIKLETRSTLAANIHETHFVFFQTENKIADLLDLEGE